MSLFSLRISFISHLVKGFRLFGLFIFCFFPLVMCIPADHLLRVMWASCYASLVMSNSLRLHGLWFASFLCPQDSLGKNTGVSSHTHLQGSFQPRDQTHTSCSSCLSVRFLTAEPLGKPRKRVMLESKPEMLLEVSILSLQLFRKGRGYCIGEHM